MSDAEKKVDEIFKEPNSKDPKESKDNKESSDHDKKPKAKNPNKDHKHIPKWLKITLLVVVILGLAGFGYWLYTLNWDLENKETKDTVASVSCPLTGLKTTKENADRRPIGIMIENSTDARPQSGISKAEMVFEAVAEGGITRFLAVYQCQDALKEIGPVRSARIYYVDWIKGFDGLYSHVGGSPDGLEEINNLNIADLNQFTLGSYYWRSTSRSAPHNVYTTIEKLYAAADSKNYKTTGKFDALKYSSKKVSEKDLPSQASLKVNFSSANYNITWTYDAKTNSWLRAQGSSKHLDAIDQTQVSAKNIAVVFTDISTRADGRRDIITTGTGDATIYVNGKEVKATWKKPTASDMLKFYDAQDKEIEFTAGNLWIEFVQSTDQKIYSATANTTETENE